MKKTKKTKACSKCSSCYGYGLWPDGTAPMGPIDASDGMPTIECQECKANKNPRSKVYICNEMVDKEFQKKLKKVLAIHKTLIKKKK